MKIVFYPNPILRKKTKPILEFNSKLKNTISKMTKIMRQNDGAGLAAPQVGVSRQIFLADDGNGLKVFINPKIAWQSAEKDIAEEGCLSFPGIFLEVERPKEIKIEFSDEHSQKQVLKADGLLARIIQHEYDHLQGILFIDYLGLWEKLKIRPALEKLEKMKN